MTLVSRGAASGASANDERPALGAAPGKTLVNADCRIPGVASIASRSARSSRRAGTWSSS